MDDGSGPHRRSVLKVAGATIGITALGSVAYASSQEDSSQKTPAIDWSRTYGTSHDDYGIDVAQSTDGGFGVLARRGIERNTQGILTVTKFDSEGNEQWTSSYTEFEHNYGYAIAPSDDDGFVFVGHISSEDSEAGNDGWLVKLDADGDIVWEQTVDSTDGDIFRDVVGRPEEGYAVTGYTSGAADEIGWLVTFTEDGTVENSVTFPPDAEDESSRFYSITPGSNGGYILGGAQEYSDEDSVLRTRNWVVKTTTTFDVQWERIFEEPGGYTEDVILTSEGDYALTNSHSRYYDSNEDKHFHLTKLNPSGDVIFSKEYNLGGEQREDTTGLIQRENGEIVLSGFHGGGSSYPPNHTSTALLATDQDGNRLWSSIYEGWTPSVATLSDGITDSADGGFVVVGQTGLPDEENDIRVVKFGGSQPQSTTPTDTKTPTTTATSTTTETETDSSSGTDIETETPTPTPDHQGEAGSGDDCEI